MGLDGAVHCNCYETGRAKPLPFSPELVRQNAEGYFELTVPDSPKQNLTGLLEEWLENGCAHPNRYRIMVRVSDWWGYRHFLEAIEKLGWERFPILYEYLPNGNTGTIPASHAAQALAEIQLFREIAYFGTHHVLVKSDTGEKLYEMPGTFIWSPDVSIGYDENGVYFLNGETDAEVFRAKRLEQRILYETTPFDHNERSETAVEYYDPDTEARFRCMTTITGAATVSEGEMKFDHPRLLHVEARPHTAADFEYILFPLKLLCEASVETGNPVIWF
jgi:hypothetical protein